MLTTPAQFGFRAPEIVVIIMKQALLHVAAGGAGLVVAGQPRASRTTQPANGPHTPPGNRSTPREEPHPHHPHTPGTGSENLPNHAHPPRHQAHHHPTAPPRPLEYLGLSEFLLVQSTTGSVAQAGAVSGALTAGNAGGLTVQGRLIDRHSQTVVLTATSLACGPALTLLTVAAMRQSPFLLLSILAALAGATIPAVITSMRVLIPDLVPSPGLRRTAYALLGTQFNLALISGPLMVSGLLVLAGPSLAVIVAGGSATLAGLAFAATSASRAWRPAAVSHRGHTPRRSRLAEILTPGMRTLVVAAFAAGVAAGLISVGVPSVVLSHGSASLAGVLFAASSLGDLLGGLVYGSRQWRATLRTQLIICQAALAVTTGLLASLTGHPRAMLPLMFASGVVQAPGGIATSALLDDVAQRGSLGQSYTSMVAAGLAGGAIGSAAGGVLSNVASGWTQFAVAAAVTGTLAAWTLLRRRTLASPRRSRSRPTATLLAAAPRTTAR